MEQAEQQIDGAQLKKWIPELLQNGQSVWIEASGFSMYPTLKPKDKLMVSPIHIQHIAPGDIVAFQQNDLFVAHRVVSVSLVLGDYVLQTKGDSNFAADETVAQADFLGRISFVRRNGKDNKVTSKSSGFRSYTVYCWIRKRLKCRFNWF